MDAACLRAGVDPTTLPAFRIANLAYALVLESPGMLWDGDARREFVEAMAWPEDAALSTDQRQDRQIREAAASLGINMTEIEKQLAFQRQLHADLTRQREAREAAERAAATEETLLFEPVGEFVAEVEAEAETEWQAEQQREPGEGD